MLARVTTGHREPLQGTETRWMKTFQLCAKSFTHYGLRRKSGESGRGARVVPVNWRVVLHLRVSAGGGVGQLFQLFSVFQPV